jgi:hypothetical protein
MQFYAPYQAYNLVIDIETLTQSREVEKSFAIPSRWWYQAEETEEQQTQSVKISKTSKPDGEVEACTNWPWPSDTEPYFLKYCINNLFVLNRCAARLSGRWHADAATKNRTRVMTPTTHFDTAKKNPAGKIKTTCRFMTTSMCLHRYSNQQHLQLQSPLQVAFSNMSRFDSARPVDREILVNRFCTTPSFAKQIHIAS